MSNLKGIEGKIPSLYRTKAIDLLVYAWVESRRKQCKDWELPFNITHIIDEFMEHFGLSEDDYSLKDAKVTYYRTKEKLLM